MDLHDCKPKKDHADEPDPDLLAHIRSLGLSAVEDYVSWCAKHGFGRRTNKHWRKRLKERAYAGRAVAPGVQERSGPAQPNFTMKGRTPTSLLRQVASWHRTLAKTEQPKAEWPPSGIAAFEWVEGSERGGNLKIWTITELLGTKALVAEGRKMKHCVEAVS